MKTNRLFCVTRLLGLCLASALLTGCISAHVQQVENDIQVARKGPKELPKRNITDFSRGLRCMDDLFLAFGASPDDYPVLIENIDDKTQKVNAGTRHMLISAISDMTKRSRAIKLVAFGQDTGNLIMYLAESGNKGVYQDVPAFDIIGAISQLDDGLVKKQADISGETAGSWNGRQVGSGGGASQSLGATVLALDLSILTVHNMAILAGAHTRNSVALYTGGSSQSYDAGINKTGVSYSISTNSKDPTAQGLRALVELSAIELIGKLAKLPYWQCLGLDPTHEEILNEVSDWYFQLSQSEILHTTMKVQLYLRGYYQGEINEEITEDYALAVMRYKQRLGLPLTADVDKIFYAAFLNETPTTVNKEMLAYVKKNRHGLYDDVIAKAEALTQPSRARDVTSKRKRSKQPKESVKPKDVPAVESEMQLTVADVNERESYAPGDEIEMKISSNTNGYVSCYFQRGEQFVKVFPNRFSTNGYLSGKGAIYMPDSVEYSFVAEDLAEELHCYMTKRLVKTDLPGAVAVEDFSILQVSSVAQLDEAYKAASQNLFSKASHLITTQ